MKQKFASGLSGLLVLRTSTSTHSRDSMKIHRRVRRGLLGIAPFVIMASLLGVSFACAPLRIAPVRPVRRPEPVPAAVRAAADLPELAVAVTRIGHASTLIELGDVVVLTDPWFSEKLHYHHGEPLAMSIEQLPRLSAVVASHAHYDHFDIETFARYPHKDVPFFVGPDMAARARAAGFTNVRELQPWEQVDVGPLRITAAPGAHKVPEVTFVLQAHGATVYFGGDTRLIPSLAEIPRRFPSIQLALLPVNGLHVMRSQVVMNAEEAARFAAMLNAEVAVPIHYRFHGSFFTDTFILDYDGTPERFAKAVTGVAPNTVARILETGERLRLLRRQ
jgi:L-ascorbate metabolism protein UlaG (beta-lactamase superfamily)